MPFTTDYLAILSQGLLATPDGGMEHDYSVEVEAFNIEEAGQTDDSEE